MTNCSAMNPATPPSHHIRRMIPRAAGMSSPNTLPYHSCSVEATFSPPASTKMTPMIDCPTSPAPDRANSDVTSCAACGLRSLRFTSACGRLRFSTADTTSRNGTKDSTNIPANWKQLRTKPRACNSVHHCTGQVCLARSHSPAACWRRAASAPLTPMCPMKSRIARLATPRTMSDPSLARAMPVFPA